jgi:hypothetical protein
VGAGEAGDGETGAADGVGVPVGAMVAGGTVAGDTFEAGMLAGGVGIGPTRDVRPDPGSWAVPVPICAEMGADPSAGTVAGLSGAGSVAGANSPVGPSSLGSAAAAPDSAGVVPGVVALVDTAVGASVVLMTTFQATAVRGRRSVPGRAEVHFSTIAALRSVRRECPPVS